MSRRDSVRIRRNVQGCQAQLQACAQPAHLHARCLQLDYTAITHVTAGQEQVQAQPAPRIAEVRKRTVVVGATLKAAARRCCSRFARSFVDRSAARAPAAQELILALAVTPSESQKPFYGCDAGTAENACAQAVLNLFDKRIERGRPPGSQLARTHPCLAVPCTTFNAHSACAYLLVKQTTVRDICWVHAFRRARCYGCSLMYHAGAKTKRRHLLCLAT